MRRAAVITLLLVGVILFGAQQSRAQSTPPITVANGFCFVGPYNTLTPCPTSPTPTPALPAPIKLLQVSAGTQAPAGTTTYQVDITSKVACFPLNEPIILYTMGVPGVAALTQIFPQYVPSPGSPVNVLVEQNPGVAGSGTARLTLEVFNAAVGPAGLNLKAVWPQEGVERLAQVIAPAPPTPTSTPVPGQPTATSTPVPTATSTPAPTATGTTTPTATATTTAPAQLFVQACVNPLIVSGHSLGGDTPTLFGRTVPGALCYPSVTYSTGTGPNDTQFLTEAATGEVADANGVVAFTWHEDSTGDYGIASVTCSLNGQSQTAYTYFFIQQANPPGPVPGGVCPPQAGDGTRASADVTQLNPLQGSNETVVGCFTANGSAVAGLPMTAYFHFYDHVSTCSGVTDGTGTARCSVNIGNARPNYPVVVETIFNYQGHNYIGITAFTPVCSGAGCKTTP